MPPLNFSRAFIDSRAFIHDFAKSVIEGGGGGGSAYDTAMQAVPGVIEYWDITDFSTMWQDDAQTTPVTGSGDPVGYLAGKLGLHDFRNTVASRRPTLNISGGVTWLENDGIDDDGLRLAADVTVKTVVGLFQHGDGTDGLFTIGGGNNNYSTMFLELGRIATTSGYVAMGQSVAATLGSVGGSGMNNASVNGAAFSSTVLPLPYSTVGLRMPTDISVPMGAIGPGNSGYTGRFWKWNFAPILFSADRLGTAEITDIAAACAAHFGSAS